VRGTSRAFVGADDLNVRPPEYRMTNFADVTIKVFGTRVDDPALQLYSIILFLPFFFGIGSLVLSTRRVAEFSDWEMPAFFDFTRSRIPPFKVLTREGRILRVAGFILVGIGILGYGVIYLIVRKR
jgi:hypothetical protein